MTLTYDIYLVPPLLSLFTSLWLAVASALRSGWPGRQNLQLATLFGFFALLPTAFICHHLVPDEAALLAAHVGAGVTRIDAAPDRLESLGDGFHRRVRQGYLDLAAAAPERWVVVDAAQGIDEVAAAVDAIVAERLGWRVDG